MPELGVTAEQALRLYTLNAARAEFAETRRGSLVPGKLADIVVLSADPTAVPPEQIGSIGVAMTVIGGAVVHQGGE